MRDVSIGSVPSQIWRDGLEGSTSVERAVELIEADIDDIRVERGELDRRDPVRPLSFTSGAAWTSRVALICFEVDGVVGAKLARTVDKIELRTRVDGDG